MRLVNVAFSEGMDIEILRGTFSSMGSFSTRTHLALGTVKYIEQGRVIFIDVYLFNVFRFDRI